MTEFRNELAKLVTDVCKWYGLEMPKKQLDNYLDEHAGPIMEAALRTENERLWEDYMEKERKEYERLRLIYEDEGF